LKHIFFIGQHIRHGEVVFQTEDYLHSRAIDYAGERGLLDNEVVIK